MDIMDKKMMDPPEENVRAAWPSLIISVILHSQSATGHRATHGGGTHHQQYGHQY